jgi:RNA polymerase sigma factor (sigma-70 family)
MEHVSINKLLEGYPLETLSEVDEGIMTHAITQFKGGEKRAEAQRKLVLASMRDAFFYARKCARARLPDEELVSLCYAALVRAAARVNPGKGRFFAYAKPYIRGAVCRAWRSLDVVRNGGNAESLDANPSPNTDDGDDYDNNAGRLDSVDPEFERIDLAEKWAIVEPLLKKLSPSERVVLSLRYQRGLNFREIGDKLKVTRSATQGTHARALRKLRNALLRQHKLYSL